MFVLKELCHYNSSPVRAHGQPFTSYFVSSEVSLGLIETSFLSNFLMDDVLQDAISGPTGFVDELHPGNNDSAKGFINDIALLVDNAHAIHYALSS